MVQPRQQESQFLTVSRWISRATCSCATRAIASGESTRSQAQSPLLRETAIAVLLGITGRGARCGIRDALSPSTVLETYSSPTTRAIEFAGLMQKTAMIDTFEETGPPLIGRFSRVEFCCEGEFAIKARFTSPRSLVFDPNGNLLFVLAGRICRIAQDGHLKTVAGIGQDRFGGDGGPATHAYIGPASIAVDSQGNLVIAEFENNRIRRADARSGIITTFAGNGLPHRPPQPIM